MPLSFCRATALGMLVLALAGLIGCQRVKAPPSPPPPPPVTVARPVMYPVQGNYEYNGYLDAVETFQARARVKGFLNEVRFREGEEVKAGDLLYEIDPREYKANVAKSAADIEKAKADIASAEAQIKLAEAELERMNRAAASGAAAKTDQDKAVATLAANRAQRDAAVANRDAAVAARQTAELELGYTRIVSPIDGRISRTLVTKGNLVGQNETTLLTTVVSLDPLYVYFDIPERDLVEHQRTLQAQAVPSGVAAQPVPIEIGVASEEGYPHRGQLDFRENRVDTGTGTVRVRGRIPNPAHQPTGSRLLYPGLYARVRTPAGPARSRPVLPEDALMTGQEGRFVYVVGPGDVVEKRTVTVGPQVWKPAQPGEAPAWVLAPPMAPPAGADKGPAGPAPVRSVVAIEKGLNPGDRVVVNGLQRARPGAPVAPDEWELRGPQGK
ncbi:MAG: hypothetical protein JWO38_5936 [Gemmataceae bacterium]|nr:hypothetical protein [Gemmataceae bacterium]